MRCGFSIKRPTATRKTFSVHRKIYVQGSKPLQPIVKDERLDSINRNFKAQVLNEHQALDQIKRLIEVLKSENNVGTKAVNDSEISAQNLKVCSKFCEKQYEGRNDIVRPHIIENEFNFALRALGTLSVVTSTKKILQAKVTSAFDEKQSKRYVGRINQLLKFVGRDFTLTHKRQSPESVSHINFKELKQILNHVDNEDLKNLYITLYCTGVRLGEAFMINNVKPNNTIYIDKQLTLVPIKPEKIGLVKKHGKALKYETAVTEIKNRKPHHTIILKEGHKAVKAWAALSPKVKADLRTQCQNPLIIAARKAFPDDILKQVSPHDLRHSFVIHLLGLGVSIDKCARLIGDSVTTTERHYAGFNMADSEIHAVQAIIKKA